MNSPNTTAAGEPTPVAGGLVLLAALAVGLIAGLGAVVFRGMIGGLHNLLFLGKFSIAYDANVHTAASPWGFWVILVPVIGAIGVAFLVKTFAPEAKGHGVPEVMDAIYYHDGKIRPVVAAVKSLASALSIGSGGAVGREGPIIQIGAAFGSMLGQWIPMPVSQRAILIAAGGGAGIAATFDTPIGGVLFAVELLLPVVRTFSLLCVSLATVVATVIGRAVFGFSPPFNVPEIASVEGNTALWALPWALALGAVMGVLAWLTTRGIYWFEDFFDRLPGSYYTRHMTGMLLVGLMLAGFMAFSAAGFGQPNHYYIEGVGYAVIMDILRGGLTATGFLLLLGAAKLLAVCLTLGSGASGGVFSPCLFIGAAVGAAVGGGLNQLFPAFGLNPVWFAIAGMAAMVGGTTGAVLTAVVMVFEMTRDYTVVLPVIVTVLVACAVRQWLLPQTIYTLKLVRRGHVVPQGLQAWMGGAETKAAAAPERTPAASKVAELSGEVEMDTASVTATIVSVDRVQRQVAVKRADGRINTWYATRDALAFDHLKGGDRVRLSVAEQLAVFLGPNDVPATTGTNATPADPALAAKLRARLPSGVLAIATEVVTLSFTGKIVALDDWNDTVTLLLSDGLARKMHVSEYVNLAGMNVGDSVSVRCTQAAAIELDKP